MYALFAALIAAAPSAHKIPDRSVVRQITADVTGDRKDEVVIVERSKNKELRVVIFSIGGEPEEEIYSVLSESTPRRADRLLRLEAKELTGERPIEIVAVFEEASPDETVQHVRVMGKAGQLFAHSVYIPREPQIEGRVVELGDASPRFAIREQKTEEGDPLPAAIAWVRGPQALLLDKGKEPTTIVIGAYETLYRFNVEKGTFVESADKEIVDFASAKVAYTVEATAQVPKIWGTAQPFWGSDGDLATAWAVANKKGGAGEALTVRFRGDEEVSLIRLVPGCASSASAWDASDRIQAFTLELSSGQRFEIDRAKLDELPQVVQAAGEFPLDGDFGAQVLLLLRQKQALRWARLTINRVEQAKSRAKDREACLSEISFH